VAVRARGNVDLGSMPVDALVERLSRELETKAWAGNPLRRSTA